MTDNVHIDFETRSVIDLKKRGLDVYSNDPSTEPVCLGVAFGEQEVGLLSREDINFRDTSCEPLLDHVSSGGLVYAHNAPFEFAIWNKVCAPRFGWPMLKIEQMRCTMAMCYAMALPGKLEDAAAAVGIDMQKDMQGHRVMLQISKPRKIDDNGNVIWWDSAEKIQRVYDYCKQDVRTERALHSRLFELSPREQALWVLDHKINERGVQIDVPAARGAMRVVAAEQLRLNAEMSAVTGGVVSACTNVGVLANWVRSRGVDAPGVAKDDIVMLLEDSSLPSDVRAALELRKEAGKSSTKKLDAMISGMGADGRVRGTLQYHAASTGRWGGRRIQPQNFVRPPVWIEDPELQDECLNALIRGRDAAWISMVYGPPMDVVSACTRAFIAAADGHTFIAADYSNIEGRKLAWLAGEQWKLDAFTAQDNKTGPELYCVTAAGIFNVEPVTITKKDPRRQIGKVSELALGFEGGVGAFVTMGSTYNLREEQLAATLPSVLESATAKNLEGAHEFWAERGNQTLMSKDAWMAAELIKRAWRDRHPAIVRYWAALRDGSILAVQNPGNKVMVGPEGRQVTFRQSGSFLWCRLPSGRVLCYPYPRLKTTTTPWGATRHTLHYKTVDSITKKWVETHTYGGKLSENITQASSRCLQAEGIVRVDAAGIPVVFHVHDEIVGEVPIVGAEEKLILLEKEMARVPTWAAGMPITVEGWVSKRYRK